MKMNIEKAMDELGFYAYSDEHQRDTVRELSYLVSDIAEELANRFELELVEMNCHDSWDHGFRAGLTHALNQLETFYGIVHPEAK